MKKILILLILALMVATPITTIAKEKTELPEYTVEGLKRIHDPKNMAIVYAEPGVTLAQYERVYLVEQYVAFKNNWQRDYNRSAGSSLSSRVSTSDMERIKTNPKTIFMELFKEELVAGGYAMATERAEDVLIVKPAILDLDVNAPDLRSSGRTDTFTTAAGSMILYVELYDSETDDLLAKALDPTSDRDSGYLQWQTGVSNQAAAKRMIKPWAQALVKGLDSAHEVTKQE